MKLFLYTLLVAGTIGFVACKSSGGTNSTASNKKSGKGEDYTPPDSIPIGLRVGQRAPELEFKNPNDSMFPIVESGII